MGIGIAILLIAVGAILTWAVDVTTSGFNLNTIGVILMVVGAVGLLVDLVLFMPRRRRYRSETVSEGAPLDAGRPVGGTAVRREAIDDSL